MPVVNVNLPPWAINEIHQLVQRGTYESVEQFMQTAVFNQTALERGMHPDALAGRREYQATVQRVRTLETERPAPVQRERTSTRSVPKAELQRTIARFALSEMADLALPFAQTETRPISERLWGQINRLMPLKLVCRWLFVANAGKKRWERLDAIHVDMADDAANVGSALEASDIACARKRDDQLATGLPRRWNAASKERFLSQIVARTTRSAQIYPGAICQYALATFDADRIVLTERGVTFARMRNPILDSDGLMSTEPSDPKLLPWEPLSRDEREFLAEQVTTFVPGEHRDLRIVLHAMSAGAVRPDDLQRKVGHAFPATDAWTDAMRRTHVSGLVARLCDMGLVRRHWEGRSVTYTLMEGAKDFAAMRSLEPSDVLVENSN